MFLKALVCACLFVVPALANDTHDSQYFNSNGSKTHMLIGLSSDQRASLKNDILEYIESHQHIFDAVIVKSHITSASINDGSFLVVEISSRIDLVTQFLLEVSSFDVHVQFKTLSFGDVAKSYVYTAKSVDEAQALTETTAAIQKLLQAGILPTELSGVDVFKVETLSEDGATDQVIHEMQQQGYDITATARMPSEAKSRLLNPVKEYTGSQLIVLVRDDEDVHAEVQELLRKYPELGVPRIFDSLNMALYDIPHLPYSKVARAGQNIRRRKAIDNTEFKRGRFSIGIGLIRPKKKTKIKMCSQLFFAE